MKNKIFFHNSYFFVIFYNDAKTYYFMNSPIVQ